MATEKREFIDPNELMRYINEEHCYSGLPMAAHICTMELLTYAPRVDAVEVVHGHWISLTDCSNAGVYCSVCYKKVWKEDYAWCNRKNKLRSNYCPNCGAKMDGGLYEP